MTLQLITKKQQIIDSLQKLNGGDFQFVARTIEEALKKSRITKLPTPEKYQKITKLYFATISLGNNYEKEVNKQREIEGLEENFKAQSTYTVSLKQLADNPSTLLEISEYIMTLLGIELTDTFSKIVYKHKEKNQFYLRVYPELAEKQDTIILYFDNDGNELSREEVEKLREEFLPKKDYVSKAQGTKKKIVVLNYKLENILYLGNIINELKQSDLNLLSRNLDFEDERQAA